MTTCDYKLFDRSPRGRLCGRRGRPATVRWRDDPDKRINFVRCPEHWPGVGGRLYVEENE